MMAETYQVAEECHGNGTFFFTDCGNRMYSIQNNPMLYHGKLCPKCLMEGKSVTLYLRGTDESNKYVAKLYAAGEHLPVLTN